MLKPMLMSASTAVIAVAVGLPVAGAVAIAGRRVLLWALPFLVALNGVPLMAGEYAVRLDQLAALTLGLALAIGIAARQRPLYVDGPTRWLIVVALLNTLSSALFSPDRRYSLMQVANVASAWAVYVVLVGFADDVTTVRRMVRQYLFAGLVASAIGVLAFVLARLGLDLGGAHVQEYVGEVAVPVGSYGTMREPNIYGSYCAAMLTLAGGLLLLPVPERSLGDRLFVRALALSAGLGLLLSFTRGAWLGSATGLALMVVLASRVFGVRIRPSRVLAPLGVLVLVGVALWFSPIEAAEFFRYKVRNLFNTQSTNAVVRLVAFGLAIEQFLQRPILGWGTYSFAPLMAEGINFRELTNWQNLWIPNFVLQVMHDTGIVGLGAFLALLGSIVRAGMRTARRLRHVAPHDAAVVLSLVAAFCTLFVPFLFTTGFSLGYAWMAPGLIGAYARVAAQAPPADSPGALAA